MPRLTIAHAVGALAASMIVAPFVAAAKIGTLLE